MRAAIDETTKRTYYYNATTERRVWEKPTLEYVIRVMFQ